ncbi:hypothetical protein K469DRAFT_243687 [Zopfia rhizophila CBS 207.26]|uniref:FabD/lysophospholipase-like protein n=1 Tax=Zopfia rhizophila CBS 207.26 TaxID=1314779 RepID=A0A6A6ES41_9PEZI|nr:hypothetical protein K469DRAFT_243687 [Zopfia rhizophila CBS 207.26]
MLPYGSRASVPARPRRAPPPPPPRVNQMPPRPQAKQGFFFATDQDSSNAVTSPLAERVCAECALHFEDLFLCNACNCVFCDRCWDRQAAHRAQRRMAGGIRHEKTDLQLAHVMDGVFSQPTDEDVYRQMFLDDISASWFGVKKDGGRLIFLDHGRYGEVMAKTNIDRSESTFCSEFSVVNATQDLRTPSLVSLVGQTGAGKSTLIKLLVDLQHQNKTQNFGAPVVGMPGKDVPTSEGVHLYLDPGSALSDAPLLYADCEGLEGGEREPIGAKLGRREFNYEDEQCDAAFALRHRHASERELAWADSAFRRSREFIVTNLYPRLLYTFSDVIIFVLRNPRVIESVFEQLVIWAAAALETSSNQPALPHAIIVLNSCEYDSTNNTWDVATVTRELLQSLSDTIYLNPTFQKYIQYWQDRNKDIDTVEKLMMCYYSSLKVVRMPSKDRPQLMKRQTHELYNEIQTNCLFARNRKAELRMLLRAGELQSYLQFAFEHFSSRLDVPFDFVQASFLNSPIPSDFGGSILKLAIKMVEQEEDPDARVIFSKLSCMVASSIMLDSVRHKIKGNADSIFPLYIQHLDTALDDFCDRHWPCEFAINRASRTKPSRHSIDSQPGPTGITKCVNVRSGHGSKGHQLRDGRVFAAGDYVSDFSFEKNQTEFQNMVYFRLEHLLNLLAIRVNSGEAEDVAAAELHRDDVMAYFYNDGPRGGVRSVHSHSVCFCCLFEPPEHCLPCGHILCTACIRTYGRFKSANVIEMYECPLETNTAGRYRPWTIYLRPEAAGLRVLSLDSGGIRNIIQLELLRLIERQLNGKLPIQSFFDLMVGSGTGGVIALGLGTRNWSVEECIEHFENICAEAFSHRAGRHVPGVGWLVESISNAKYDNLPLDISLKKAFSDDQYLFGGPRHRGLSDLNVNVALATSTSAGNGVVLANYNRQQTGRARYQFYRSENLAAEFKTWEAARACMATPKLFKPLQHSLSKQSYLESSIHHQNPIHIAMNECKALRSVPYGVSEHPDIVLSLGSGLYAKTPNAIGPLTLHPLRTFSIRHRAVKIPEYRISMAAHCERVWDDCINSLSGSTPSSAFVRLNPEIPNGFADFESYDSMKILRRRITEQFYDDARIKKLAAQLVATLFYFESSNLTREAEAENFVVKGKFYPALSPPVANNHYLGKILCRLPNETPEVREVGRFLKTRGNGHAHFLIAENPKAPQYFEISPSIVDNMIRFMEFNMDPICVHLSSKDSVLRASLLLEGWEQNSISGFPRSLASQEDGKASKCPGRRITV